VAAGKFSSALPVLGGFDSGVILSTGEVASVVGPNEFADCCTQNLAGGDSDLEALLKSPYSPNATVSDGGDGLNNSQTSIGYASAGDPIAVSDVILIDSEQMLVTLVDSGTNTVTVTRAASGTGAAAHMQGAIIYSLPIPTFDAAVLEFDFVPETDIAAFRFVFASDEYQEWANTQYNDVFAFYVNGVNCAVVPSTTTPISVNTINNGNPHPDQDPVPHNPALYRNNDVQTPAVAPLDTEMDGLTVVLTCLTSVNEGVTNHIKLAIADASDDQFDSVVFIQANSFVGSGPGDTDCNSQITSVDALFVLRAAAGLPVTAQCMPNGDVNCSGSLNAVDALLILRFAASLPVTLPPGCPPIGSGPPSPTASPSPSPAPGTLQLTAGDNFFDPQQLDVTAGQAFVIDVSNVGSAIHNVHLDGDDDQFDTGDDIVSSPDVILGGNSAQVGGILASPGIYNFRCDFHPDQMTGTITAS
jgi:plastocyanin